jgi:hypothetical protein
MQHILVFSYENGPGPDHGSDALGLPTGGRFAWPAKFLVRYSRKSRDNPSRQIAVLANLTLVCDGTSQQKPRHGRMHRLTSERAVLASQQTQLCSVGFALWRFALAPTDERFTLSRHSGRLRLLAFLSHGSSRGSVLARGDTI